jgi:hypothetical protein
MAKIEQNGSCSPPLGTPKTMQDGCIAARSLSFAAIAGHSPDNAGTTPRNQGPGTGHRTFQGVAGGDLWASGTTAAPPGRLRSEPGQQTDHPFPGELERHAPPPVATHIGYRVPCGLEM